MEIGAKWTSLLNFMTALLLQTPCLHSAQPILTPVIGHCSSVEQTAFPRRLQPYDPLAPLILRCFIHRFVQPQSDHNYQLSCYVWTALKRLSVLIPLFLRYLCTPKSFLEQFKLLPHLKIQTSPFTVSVSTNHSSGFTAICTSSASLFYFNRYLQSTASLPYGFAMISHISFLLKNCNYSYMVLSHSSSWSVFITFFKDSI